MLEIISLFVRLIMASRLTGMNIKEYARNVIIPTLTIIIIPTLIALIPHLVINKSIIRLFLVCGIYGVLILMYWFALDKTQRAFVVSRINILIKNKK